MNPNLAGDFLSWLWWAGGLVLLITAQTAFLPAGGEYNMVPHISFPLLVFCFLHKGAGFSLSLALFAGFVFAGFSHLSAPVLMAVFVLCFLFALFVKAVVFPRPAFLYFGLVFLLSLSFPYIVDFSFNFRFDDLSLFQWGLCLLKSFSTLALSVPFWLFFKWRMKKWTKSRKTKYAF